MLGRKHSEKTLEKMSKSAIARGTPYRYPYWACKPQSKNSNTGYWRAKKIIPRDKCSLFHEVDCKGSIQIHHIDKNPLNNSKENLIAVCVAHHRFLESGKITIENPVLPEFYIDGSGKRRYSKS